MNAKDYLKAQNSLQPNELEKVPKGLWPSQPENLQEVWRSREFLVMIFDSGDESAVERMSIIRTVIEGNGWKDMITWDEIQKLKGECGRGPKWAVEVFPADGEVVNVANMRHLWIVPECPGFAWRKGGGEK